jgi:light-regulated signal transduction histidine kinase (bacteriophytochrome)
MKQDQLDLTLIANRIVERLREADPARNVDVKITNGLTATGDEVLVRSLLENLLSNAWKFSSKTDDASIEFGRTEKDGRIFFYIRDNGAGFDMAYRDKLFGAFQRLHSPVEFEGTGIGLATVQRIVSRHRGTVDAVGEPDAGATFYFSLN